MEHNFLVLARESKLINPDLFSVIRFQIMSGLADIAPDSATYRELKASLDLTDGALYSNLKALEKMGYLKSETIKIGNKKLEAYKITIEGIKEWSKARAWLCKFLRCNSDDKHK